jgi:hypothetical protein
MADAEPTREQILDWCRANPGHGYTKAGKHFGISAERVKAIVGEPLTTALDPSKKTPTPRVPADSVDEDELDDLAALERETLAALRVRTKWLAKPESVGSRGEQGAAIALGILVDKLEKVRAIARGQDGGRMDDDSPEAREASAAGVRRALGLDPGPGDEG